MASRKRTAKKTFHSTCSLVLEVGQSWIIRVLVTFTLRVIRIVEILSKFVFQEDEVPSQSVISKTEIKASRREED